MTVAAVHTLTDRKRRQHRVVVALGRLLRGAARLRGGGSALPGLFAERVSPDFVRDALDGLPHGVVVVSGTNGKTTTTRIITALLESQGLRVFTNPTGSNLVRGVAAALLSEVRADGRLDADVAVLELDEAHAVRFVEAVRPRHAVLLNVMRDQLDRFGEIDTTARLLAKVAQATDGTLVLNREDPRIAAIAEQAAPTTDVRFFGLADELLPLLPGDDELHGQPRARHRRQGTPDVTVTALRDAGAEFAVGDREVSTPLTLRGAYNAYNAAAALAAVRAVVPGADTDALIAALAEVTPAFGRGEVITVGAESVELMLVKNPAGFRLGLESFGADGHVTMVAVNDDYADGRDTSWLWDVDFTTLQRVGAVTSGRRAHDAALRLQYDDVPVDWVEPDLPAALDRLLQTAPGTPKRIFCTYTAMLRLRRSLARMAPVEAVS